MACSIELNGDPAGYKSKRSSILALCVCVIGASYICRKKNALPCRVEW